MKCIFCGAEYSEKVLRIHQLQCKSKEMTEEELRQLAKDNKIKSWHNKSIDTLKKELEV